MITNFIALSMLLHKVDKKSFMKIPAQPMQQNFIKNQMLERIDTSSTDPSQAASTGTSDTSASTGTSDPSQSTDSSSPADDGDAGQDDSDPFNFGGAGDPTNRTMTINKTLKDKPVYRDNYLIAGDFKDSYFLYPAPSFCGVKEPSIDNANVLMARQRMRSKRCIDGVIAKTADYYASHYNTEFVDSENAPWWGQNEY
jgi:hypothetical protein